MALEFDTRHAPRRAAQYLQLVKAIRAASDADETDWLEWKSQLDFRPSNRADKSALAHVARAIVGFANRQPEDARRNVEGYAFFVVGVDPQGYYGAEEIDGVDLDQQITPIVGEGINWWPTYVHVTEEEHERLPVLVITVDPPRWGDPIACIRKQLQYPPKEVLHEATIFVRRWGQTDRVRAADIDRLGDRLQRAQRVLDVDVAVQQGGVTPVLVPEREADMWVGKERERLMKPLEDAAVRSASLEPAALNRIVEAVRQIPDGRSRQQYEEEVHRYLDDLRAALPTLLPEAAAITACRIVLRLHNRLDTHLEKVEVRLELPEGITALLPQSAGRASRESLLKNLPQPPRLYGPRSLNEMAGNHYAAPSIPWAGLLRGASLELPRYRVSIQDGAVVFPGEDLRVRLYEDLAPVVLVSERPLSAPVAVSWTATATNMDGEARGMVLVPAQLPKSLMQLLRESETNGKGHE